MSILSRYISLQILKNTAFVFAILVGLFAFFDVINQLNDIGHGDYRLPAVFLYVALGLPGRVYELFPIAVLIGSLFALSQLSGNSELTVVRSSGISNTGLLWKMLPAGLLLAASTLLIGEYIAPPAEKAASQLRLKATNSLVAQEFRSGLWVKDGTSFVNVNTVHPDNSLEGIRIYKFDKSFVLLSVSLAAKAEFVKGSLWTLHNVEETVIHPDRVDTRKLATADWNTVLNPSVLSVLLVQPEKMPIPDLYHYIKQLQDNKQKASRYEIALWTKLMYPGAALAMLLLALPFAQTQRRSGSVGVKLFVGVMLGLGFHFSNGLFRYLGLLYDWPPLLAATFPTLTMVSFGVLLMIRQERR